MVLFAEDTGHELFVGALIRRVAAAEDVEVRVDVRNATGGQGRALVALRRYVSDLAAGRDAFVEVLVAAIDGNCHGYVERRREIEDAIGDRYPGRLVPAVPDPHVERWMLSDPRALAAALGTSTVAVDIPPYKCERGRYKAALRQAVNASGVVAPLGGAEYADDVVANLDLARVGADPSLARFVDDLGAALRSASQGAR